MVANKGQPVAIVLLLALVAGLFAGQPIAAADLKLNAPLPTEGDVLDFGISPDGRHVVYRAGAPGGAVELHSVPLSGGPAVLLGASPYAGGIVEPDYQVSPDGSHVVFRAPGSAPGSITLYSVPIAGPTASAVELSAPVAGKGKVGYFHITADSRYVVYRADRQGNGTYELYSVPLAGPAAAAVTLNGRLTDGGNVYHSFISPDDQRVVYLADQEDNEVLELYSVPTAGPASAGVKLSAEMVAGGDVSSFLISPDARHVVYLADQETDGVSELWAVPIDGSGSDAVKLSGDLVALGNVQSFLISPDGGRVVYLADQQADNVWELYSVPTTGPAEAGTRLSGTLARGGDVASFSLSPDGSRVIYLADQTRDDVPELYRVPIAGPASTGVKLNVPLVDGGGVVAAEISPDSSRVIYRADAQVEDAYDLYSVSLAGSASAGVKLNAALPSGGDVVSFQVSQDSKYVVYIADQELDGIEALYRVPLAGLARAAVKLSTTGAPGSVWSFQLVPGSGQVVYRADLGATGVDELYTATVE